MLITGASSLLVQRLIRRIDSSRFRVVGLSRRPERIAHLDIEVVEGDLRDPASLRQAVVGISMVIHGAAVTHSHDPSEYFETNVEGTEALLEACRAEPSVRRFALISSRSASENSGHYGRSKLKAEVIVRKALLDWTILRPGEIFGGDKHEGVDRIIHDALRKRFMPCPSGLKNRLYPLHIDDAAALMHRFLFEAWESYSTHVLNGRDSYTVVELVQHVARVSGRRVLPIPIPRIALLMIARFVSLGRLKIGFAPDQVPRLYSAKPVEHHEGKMLSVNEYLSDSLSSPR